MARRTVGPQKPRRKQKAKAPSLGETEFPRAAVSAATYSLDMAWDYSKEHKKRIIHWLNPPAELTGDRVAWCLKEIIAAARYYLGEVDYEKNRRPLTREIRKQLRDLARSLEQLHSCMAALSPEGRAALDSLALVLDRQPVTPALDEALRFLGRAHCIVGAAAGASEKTGRPTKAARRNFIKRLAAIWAVVHGEWPRRTGWEDEREDFPFNDFVWECAEPIAGKSGLDDAIREVCEMDPNSTEAILATYVPSEAPKKK